MSKVNSTFSSLLASSSNSSASLFLPPLSFSWPQSTVSLSLLKKLPLSLRNFSLLFFHFLYPELFFRIVQPSFLLFFLSNSQLPSQLLPLQLLQSFSLLLSSRGASSSRGGGTGRGGVFRAPFFSFGHSYERVETKLQSQGDLLLLNHDRCH
jgi:hypothetical protein